MRLSDPSLSQPRAPSEIATATNASAPRPPTLFLSVSQKSPTTSELRPYFGLLGLSSIFADAIALAGAYLLRSASCVLRSQLAATPWRSNLPGLSISNQHYSAASIYGSRYATSRVPAHSEATSYHASSIHRSTGSNVHLKLRSMSSSLPLILRYVARSFDIHGNAANRTGDGNGKRNVL